MSILNHPGYPTDEQNDAAAEEFYRCAACGHSRHYHFDDGNGNVVCRATGDCECVHRIESFSDAKETK